MAVFEEYYINSCDCKNKVHCCKWSPEGGEPRAVVQIAHGIAEYIQRYDGFARFLAGNGFVVVGNDHLGHGKTVENEEDFCYFGDDMGWFLALEDMHRLYERTSDEYPDAPYFLLGHSMGSFLARTYLINYPGELDGCILSGTGQQAPEICNMGVLVAKEESLRLGKKGRSPLVNNLCFGKYNIRIKNPRTDVDWISRENSIVDAYVSDILCGGIPTNSLVIDMLNGIRYIQKRSKLMKMDKKTPVLFFSGTEDPVGNYGKGVTAACSSFRAAGCQDVTLKLYPGGRHEMLNETNKEEVYADVLAWLESKIQ